MGGTSGIFRLRLNGRYLAYAESFSCDKTHGDCRGDVKVVDLRSGRRSSQQGFFAYDTPEQPAEPYVMHDLVLTGTGTAAFIVGAQDDSVEVWLLSPGKRSRLDRAPDIETGSLAISTNWVYWTRAGLPQATRLP